VQGDQEGGVACCRHAVVDAPAAATKGASLVTLRWCRSRDCRRRVTPGCPCFCCCYYCRSHRSRCSCLSLYLCPFPYLFHCCWGREQEGEGPSEKMTAPVVVGVEAAATTEGALHLRALSRTWRPIPGPSSGPTQFPRVLGHCGQCGRGGMTVTA
jgi:hypothetical protein